MKLAPMERRQRRLGPKEASTAAEARNGSAMGHEKHGVSIQFYPNYNNFL
jgi:hypothetical protein